MYILNEKKKFSDDDCDQSDVTTRCTMRIVCILYETRLNAQAITKYLVTIKVLFKLYLFVVAINFT